MHCWSRLIGYCETFNGNFVIIEDLRHFNPNAPLIFTVKSECIIFTVGTQNFIIYYNDILHSYTFYKLDNANKLNFITTRISREVEIFNNEIEKYITAFMH